MSLNIKKCTHVLGRAFHQCKKSVKKPIVKKKPSVKKPIGSKSTSAQWAFLHWWRALLETCVHFLMFNDTLKSFPLPFSCFYSVTHCFPIFQFLICYSPLVAKSARHICNVLAVKRDSYLALTCERCLVSIFFWPTSWILLKQLFLSPS